MKTETIANGATIKTFLWINLDKGTYDVEKIECSDYEIEDGCLSVYDIDPDEKYSLFTASAYVSERSVIDMEVGDVLEIGCGETIMRIG